ncbi:MAG: hypothetical protein IBX40_04445 [Methanosarcinales archaeon]|nr:hypothetical protein [Methanosarcinales archaeon]
MAEFNVQKKRERINVFKIGKGYVLKYFFDDKEIFKSLVDYYNSQTYQFEMKSVGARNKVMKYLEMKAGFDVYIVEDPTDFMVKVSKDKKYSAILKNSVDYQETKDLRIFIMKDMAAVEEAISLGAEKYEG